MAKMTQMELEDLADAKVAVLKEFLNAQPPIDNGEAVLAIWDKLYDSTVQSVVVETVDGPSSEENPVFPYEQLEAIARVGRRRRPRRCRRALVCMRMRVPVADTTPHRR